MGRLLWRWFTAVSQRANEDSKMGAPTRGSALEYRGRRLDPGPSNTSPGTRPTSILALDLGGVLVCEAASFWGEGPYAFKGLYC